MTKGRNILSGMRKNYYLYLFLIPTMLYLIVFQVYPIVNSFTTSFTDLQLIKPNSGKFIGLGNYVKMLTSDKNFWPIVKNTLIWVFGSTILQYFFAIPAALCLNQKFRGRSVFRGLMMVPWVTPVIIMGLIWRWIYDGDYGLLNYILGTKTVWLGNPTTVWGALLTTSLWKGMPYATLMFLAGLQGIPVELYEAAYVDGCNAWNRFTKITMPLLMPVILVTALTSIVQSWTKFEVIWVMTAGGPGYTTSILPTYIYTKSFVMYDMGTGSALSVISMLFMMIFVIVYLKVYNRNAEGVN